MTESTLQVSVIVPAYKPGDGIHRVIDSLDAQTLPPDQFEIIIIDDGSPDDTFGRLTEFARTRPNLRVERIENSGWPSRPRNIATHMARGEYVVYMDHDDSLFPDALRRATAYARDVKADVLNVKEMKTSDAWWCMPALAEGNAADIRADHRIDRMLPMVPHKMYRREFLLENDITYPEGRRMLWEDIYFNVEAYAKAEKVAVLADAPFYVWHSSTTNNSKSYGPLDMEFWDRMDDLMRFIDATLSQPELESEHREALLHQYRGRVVGRLGKALQNATASETRASVARARKLQERHIPPEWDALLGPWNFVRAAALRADRPDLLAHAHRLYGGLSASVETQRVAWVDGVLEIDISAHWRGQAGDHLTLERRGTRIGMPLPEEFSEILDSPWIDLTDTIQSFSLDLGARSRDDHAMWQLPLTQEITQADVGDDGVRVTITGHARFDPATVAGGDRADPDVWDVLSVCRWAGLGRAGRLRTKEQPHPALLSGTPAVAYRSNKGGLAIDLRQQLRSVASDGGATTVTGAPDGARTVLALPRVVVTGKTTLAVDVLLCDTEGSPRPDLAPMAARLLGENGEARLELDAQLPAGSHRLAFRTPTGTVKSRYVLTRTTQGVELSLAAAAPKLPTVAKAKPKQPAPRKSLLRRIARRLLRR